MNATEKAQILKRDGYFHHSTNIASLSPIRTHVWQKKRDWLSEVVGKSTSYAEATTQAYQYYLKNNQPESPSVASETIFKVGDSVSGNINDLLFGVSGDEISGREGVVEEINLEKDLYWVRLDGELIYFSASELTLAKPEPAIPQPLAELEALRQQVASHAEWASVVKRQWDELLAEKVKMEGDLQAAQATIVQFGIESEAMRTDFAEKHAKDSRINLNLSEENAKQSRMLDAVIAENTANRIALHEIANNNWNADRMRRTALEAYKAPMQQTASLEALKSTDVVTLTDDELRWIAEQWNGKLVVRINPFSVPTKYQHLVRSHHQSDLFTDFTIAPEYDTEINRKAIEARRKQFVEKA